MRAFRSLVCQNDEYVTGVTGRLKDQHCKNLENNAEKYVHLLLNKHIDFFVCVFGSVKIE